MRCKMIIAIAVVAAFVLSVIPLASDDSDAYDLIAGDGGVGFSIKGLSGEDLDKIMPADRKTACAEGVLEALIADASFNYDFTDIVISDYAMKTYYGGKIEGKEQVRVSSFKETFDIKFKATCNAGGGQLFDNEYQNVAIIKEVGKANLSQLGAVFEISSHVEKAMSEHSVLGYEKNSAGNLVLTRDDTKMYEMTSYESEVKYSFKVDETPKSFTYTSKIGDIESGHFDITYDFDGTDIADVTAVTRALLNTKIDQYVSVIWNKVKFGDDEIGPNTIIYDPDENTFSYDETYHAYRSAKIYAMDLKVLNYSFYSASPGLSDLCLFQGDDVDASLRTNDDMRNFLSEHGSVADTFAGAESGADSIYTDMTFSDAINIAVIICIALAVTFGILFIVFVVIIIVIAKKKR